jgi:hypothetical protein
MTKKEITLLKKFYATRIESLKFASSSIYFMVKDEVSSEYYDNLLIMLAEYSDKLDNLSINKEYMITFEGGGWNTCHATNDEDALKFAKAKYNCKKFNSVKSVRLATKSGIDAAMRSFY